MVLCDSFNIPIMFLVDVPGFLIGFEGELRGAPGSVINWMNAMTLVTVPKITIIMRKSYGQAYINMGGGRNADGVACGRPPISASWTRARGDVVHGVKREQDDPERYQATAGRDDQGHVGLRRRRRRPAVHAGDRSPIRHARLPDLVLLDVLLRCA